MSYHYLIFDVNLLFNQAYNAINSKLKGELQKVDVDELNCVYPQSLVESILRINSIIDKYGSKESHCYFLFDNPDTMINIRKLITSGEYKKSREQKGIQKKLYATLDLLFNIIINYNDKWSALKGESLEADDLTKPLIDILNIDKDSKCLCVSSDLDWARNISNNVHWFNWKRIYDAETFRLKFGYDPVGNKVQMDKTIRGDKSDNIKPALPNLPTDLLLHIINTYSNINDLIDNCQSDLKLKNWTAKILKNRKALTDNYDLTDFLEYQKDIKNEMVQGQCNPAFLDIFYSSLNMEKESWFSDFEKKQNEPQDICGHYLP